MNWFKRRFIKWNPPLEESAIQVSLGIEEVFMSTVLRTAVMRIMSEMLDDPDEHGIYPTGRFMDRIEALLESMMVAPEVMQLSGSEAVFGFSAWLTSKDEADIIEAMRNNGIFAGWCEEFYKANKLSEPREMWDQLLTHPIDKAA